MVSVILSSCLSQCFQCFQSFWLTDLQSLVLALLLSWNVAHFHLCLDLYIDRAIYLLNDMYYFIASYHGLILQLPYVEINKWPDENTGLGLNDLQLKFDSNIMTHNLKRTLVYWPLH